MRFGLKNSAHLQTNLEEPRSESEVTPQFKDAHRAFEMYFNKCVNLKGRNVENANNTNENEGEFSKLHIWSV